MNAQLHPVMAAVVGTFIQPRRTDGPWQYDPDAREVIAPHCGYHDEPIATVSSLGGEGHGNGHLLAAAHDLRSALRRLMDCMTERGNEDALAQARRALAKADGIGA